MSSIINKSNTRFKPKFNSRPNSRQQPQEPETKLADKNEDSIDPLNKVAIANDIPIQSTQVTQVADSNKTETYNDSTALPEKEAESAHSVAASSLNNIKQRRASTRLGSISHGTLDNTVTRRPSFMQSRRPSLNNNSQYQVVATPTRVNDILQTTAAAKTASWRTSVGKDSALMSMKRRRKSSVQLKSARAKTVAKISSVKKLIDTSSSENSRNGTPELAIDNENGSVEDQESNVDKYKIKTLKDIPRIITQEESELYTFDDSSFTMAELCKPTLPIGVVTANYEISKEAAKKKRAERERRKALRKMARLQNKSLAELTKEEDEQQEVERKKEQKALLDMEIVEPEAAPDLQLKLDKEGNIIVDEASTVIDKHQQYSVLNRTKEVTQETNFTHLHNNSSYTKQAYTDPWTVDEEIKFYKSLSKWGTDFNFIAQLFPYRTRRQIKLKFSLEERKNPVLLELALKRKLPFDFEMFIKECTVANTDPTQPVSPESRVSINKLNIFTLEQYEERLAEVRRRHEESLAQIELGKEMAKSEDHRMIEERERDKDNNKGKNNTFGAGGLTQEELGKRRAGEIVVGIVGQRKVEES